MIQQVLTDFGLSSNEVKVYLALLPMARGCSTAIGNRADMSRNTVRSVAQGLVKKGLAHETSEGGTNFYKAESPEKLIFLLEQEKNKVQKKTEDMNRALSKLKSIHNPSTALPKVRFFEGIEGIKKVYEDTLLEGETIFAFHNVEYIHPELETFLANDYVFRRKDSGIEAFVLATMSQKNSNYKYLDEKFLRQTQLFPEDMAPLETEVNVYGNKVAICSYQENEMFGFIVESSAIAKTIKSVFDFCWKMTN